MGKKIIGKLFLIILKMIEVWSSKIYIKLFAKYLKFLGVNISQPTGYIHPSVEFDGVNYKLITIGERTTISKNVLILTHDYSINRGLYYLKLNETGRFLKPINIGSNCFIGARAVLLPGTSIGDNVIVGTGAVVKGNIPNNSIVVGNPAKVIGNIEEWSKRHVKMQDYQKDNI